MAVSQQGSASSSKATQDFVPIKEVRDGIVILKDNSMRAVLMASSLNFALKSADEQQAIIFQFQNFLNSLDFSVQFTVQSRRLDIRPYIALLESREKVQTNDLLKVQIREYIKYIKNITDNVNIMAKSFFVVVPYSPAVLNVNPLAGKLGTKNAKTGDFSENFEENKTQLEKRLSIVSQGIARCGVRSIQLGTEELVEVFYKLFNPGDVEKPIPSQ